jgi:NADPH2:quinone reductase
VCNTKNIETVRSLGADKLIDYTQEDFTANGQTYDVIFDGSLAPGGRLPGDRPFAQCGTGLVDILDRRTQGDFSSTPSIHEAGYPFLKQLIEARTYRVVFDQCYPLEEVVDATRYVVTEQMTGNVVLTVNGGRGR